MPRLSSGSASNTAASASTFKALFELAFLGEGLELEFFEYDAANAFLNPLVLQNTPESTSPVLDAWQHLDIVAFVLCYFVYVILILIVMLNLLIAMMSATYEDTAQTARLAYRVD